MRAVFAAVVGLFLISGQVLAQGAPEAPVILPEKLKQIAPTIWIIPDESRPMVPNVGFVVGQTAVLVIDTGMGDKNGVTVAGVARKLAPNKRIYLVTTHFHPEHDMGANGFPKGTGADGSTLIRAASQQQDIFEFGCTVCKAFSDRSVGAAELLKGATYRKADETFDQEHVLDLGGVTARIVAAGANHTRGDTVVWVESEKVLFSGDVIMKPQPSFSSPYSTVSHWLSTLDALAKLPVGTIVPSHGPTGGAELISGYKFYLSEVRDRTAAEKKAGRTEEDAANTVTAAMATRFTDKARLMGAARAAFKEAP